MPPATSMTVALVAADAVGLVALLPARDALDAFAVAWREEVWTTGAFDAKGLRAVIVASSDGLLPAALALETRLPVIRVPTSAGARAGIDLLCDVSTANLPAGDGAPFATVAIGEPGAKNAALFVVSLLGLTDQRLWEEWLAFRQRQTDAVLGHATLPED